MAETDPERAPLLPESQAQASEERDGPASPLKRAGRWIARHAVVVFATLLILAAVIVLSVFFGGQYAPPVFQFVMLIVIVYRKREPSGPPPHPHPHPKTPVCQSPACVHASSEILYNLHPQYKELDPCTNFEELVCGGWDDRHDLRPDQGDAFTGTIMSENSQMLLRHILEAPYPDNSDVS